MKHVILHIFAILIFLVCFSNPGYAQPGTLDSSFGNNGKFHYDSLKVVGLRSFAIQKDGKFLVAGNLRGENAKRFEGPGLQRFDSDGTLDKSFGSEGIVLFDELNLPQHVGYIVKVSIDKHDKIVVCATVSPVSRGFNEMGLIRLNSNGTLDLKFNKTGLANISLGYEHWELDMIIQSDNKILVAGLLDDSNGNSQYHFLMRSLADGRPDTTFGYRGLVRNYSGILKNQKLIQQPDGKIILSAVDFPYPAIQLERYNANGSNDSTFGTNGTVRKLFSGFSYSSLTVESLALQKDGSIIAGGQIGGTLGMSRFDSTGKFDSTFGNGAGYYKYQPNDNGSSTARTIFIADNDKILGAGVFYWDIYSCPSRDCNNGLVVFRLSKNGNPDSTFGVNGIGLADFYTEFENGSPYRESGKAVIQKDGKVVVSGTFSSYVLGMARFNTKKQKISNELLKNEISFNRNHLQDINNDARIKLYPNPAQNNLLIQGLETKSKIKISVIDLRGNVKLVEYTTSTNYLLNISKLAGGYYILKINTDDKVITKPFIKN